MEKVLRSRNFGAVKRPHESKTEQRENHEFQCVEFIEDRFHINISIIHFAPLHKNNE